MAALALAAFNLPLPSHVLRSCRSSTRVNCFRIVALPSLLELTDDGDVCITLMTPIATRSSESRRVGSTCRVTTEPR
jgi:hypothetical protein